MGMRGSHTIKGLKRLRNRSIAIQSQCGIGQVRTQTIRPGLNHFTFKGNLEVPGNNTFSCMGARNNQGKAASTNNLHNN
jgi:hypothetical protein